MGRYISQDDINNLFGSVNVAKWSNLNNQDDARSPDATRITAAITYAEDRVDDRLRGGPYAIPFASAPTTIKDIAARLAGVWLYESRGIEDFDPEFGRPIHRLQWHRQHAERQLDAIVRGQLDLNKPRSEVGPSAPTVI